MKRSLHPIRNQQARRRITSLRSGTTTVEFALVAPTLFLMFFGAIEFARLNQVCNSAANAAYAGCRKAIVPGGTAAGATSAAQAMLNSSLIRTATITINPTTITSTTTSITVTIAIPMDSNGWMPGTFSKGKTITRACTLTREKTN
jgi:Flp pilus assembly protein TadG